MSVGEQIRRRKQVDNWHTKIGSYIGNRIDPNVPEGAVPGSEGTPPSDSLVFLASDMLKANILGWREYTLSSFPEGYILVKKYRSFNAKNPNQSDLYLCGSQWVHFFRSPEEFYEHAYWLFTRKEGACGCQYCDETYPMRGGRKKVCLTLAPKLIGTFD